MDVYDRIMKFGFIIPNEYRYILEPLPKGFYYTSIQNGDISGVYYDSSYLDWKVLKVKFETIYNSHYEIYDKYISFKG